MTSTYSYRDPNVSIDDRVADLLSRMTVEEKAAQLDMLAGSWGDARAMLTNGEFDPEKFGNSVGEYAPGSIHQREDRAASPGDYAASVNAAQRYLVAKTRLGIPALVISETLHGHVGPSNTVFPQAICLASSWNCELAESVGAVIAREARACGSNVGLSPVLDCARDPRWGRIEETYGEDPYLVSRMAVAMVFGLQGRNLQIARDRIIATPKHFAGHGGPLGGRDSAPVGYGLRHLRETYLPPFEAALCEAGAGSVMAAYSDWDGIPCNASRQLLTVILRGEWGFDGYVIEDMGASYLLGFAHSVVQSPDNGPSMAVRAGVDQSFGTQFAAPVLESVFSGRLSEEQLNRAVARVLRAKFLLGLFENPEADAGAAAAICDAPEHRELAREAARQGIVLLKNEGAMLPLSKDLARIAVIGPNAATVETGDYSGMNPRLVSPLEGISAVVSRRTEVVHARGCDLMGIPAGRWVPVGGKYLTPKGTARGFAPQPGTSGLLAELFSNPDLAGDPVTCNVHEFVYCLWGSQSPDGAPGIPASGYSVRWSGTLTPEFSGMYRIGVTHSDCARLRLDSRTVIEHWEGGVTDTRWVEVELEADRRYGIELEYACIGNHGECRLVWRRAGEIDESALIGEAVDAARGSDVAVVFVGGGLAECGEVRDSADLDLPGRQAELIRAVHGTGTPVVLVHVGGRPHTMAWVIEHIPAIVNMWYAGEEGGRAIAEVLFGDVNPCGKLPVTWPAFVGQLPMPYDESQTGRGPHWGYVTTTNEPAFPFGYGLSYTSFAYGNMRVAPELPMGSDVEVLVDITNTGQRAGIEVAQLYVRDVIASVKRPLKQLRGFERVSLESGETKTVRFVLKPEHLAFWDARMERRTVEPGEFKVMVGGDSHASLGASFVLKYG